MQEFVAQERIAQVETAKNAAPRRTGPAASAPAHEVVYQLLRERILFGEMAPGQPVTIKGLTELLDAGMTPVREAIRRLISEGALVFQGNRRVSVPNLSAQDAEQIIFLRKTIEKELIRRAAPRIPEDAINQLEQIDEQLDQSIFAGDIPGYLRGNYRFHILIHEHADARVLAEVADRLWLRFGPSLRVVCGRFGTQSLPDLHKDILAALKAADPEAAAKALELDVAQGVEQVLAVLREAE